MQPKPTSKPADPSQAALLRIAAALNRGRRARDLSQQDLGDMASVNRKALRKIENAADYRATIRDVVALVASMEPAWLERIVAAFEDDREGFAHAMERMPASVVGRRKAKR